MQASPSSRRAWIEIAKCWPRYPARRVALLAEGVDRNSLEITSRRSFHVALLAEGVDRNKRLLGNLLHHQVALLAEGVDRNCKLWAFLRYWYGRPPRGGRG